MGGGSKGKDLPYTSLVPESALSADARISDILVKLTTIDTLIFFIRISLIRTRGLKSQNLKKFLRN